MGANLGKMIKLRRLKAELTLNRLSDMSGVSTSHLVRIEKGQRFPSARVLHKIAKPLGIAESELFTFAGYLSPQDSNMAESSNHGKLDPYVATVLSQEPAELQLTVIGIHSILKDLARADCNITEYIRRNYPEVDEDIVTMIQNILENPPRGG